MVENAKLKYENFICSYEKLEQKNTNVALKTVIDLQKWTINNLSSEIDSLTSHLLKDEDSILEETIASIYEDENCSGSTINIDSGQLDVTESAINGFKSL